MTNARREALWEFLAALISIQKAIGTNRSLTKASQIDTDVVLPVLLKELDHIQAIIGRYDTFFFLMKQICLGSIFAILAVYLGKPFPGIGFLAVVPPLFYAYEYLFRCAYWSAFIFRVLEIEQMLNLKAAPSVLYKLNTRHDFLPRARLAYKTFDIVFYFSLAGIVLLFSSAFGDHPWSVSWQRS